MQRREKWVTTEWIQQNCEVMKNSAPAWESRVWQSTSSDEKHKTLSKVDKSIFLWSYLYTNRSDWMAACINHLYCIGITLSTSPQKVFCHRLGNIWLYPSGKVGPRKVFNNPRKLFERYRWMEKKFWIVWRDSPYYQVNYNNGSSQFSSLFRSDDDICLHLCQSNQWIMKTLFMGPVAPPQYKTQKITWVLFLSSPSICTST